MFISLPFPTLSIWQPRYDYTVTPPSGMAGRPMGLLLALTYSS